MGRRGEVVAPLRPALLRTLADVQERLTFRAHAFIKVCHLTSALKKRGPVQAKPLMILN